MRKLEYFRMLMVTLIILSHPTLQVLGGTGDVGNWSTAPNAEQRNAIWQQCLRLMPSLAEVYLRF